VLAATGPLLQAWLSRVRPNTRIYRLYALSNTASVLALLSYPFLFETRLSRQHQAGLWSAGFVLYSVFACGVLTVLPAFEICCCGGA